jgi:hypothetical protein
MNNNNVCDAQCQCSSQQAHWHTIQQYNNTVGYLARR